jgi:hypothetical protein
MSKFVSVLLSVSMCLSGYAWADTQSETKSKTVKAKKCLFPKSKKRAPAWVCDAHAEGLALAAVGVAPKSKAGLALMEQMAEADARAKLAKEVRGVEQSSAAAAEAAADSEYITALEGSKVIKHAYGPNGTLYVLMGFDAAEAQKLRGAGK